MTSPRRPLGAQLVVGALALLVAIVATLGTWQVLAARSSQQSVIRSGEVTAARLASTALSSALSSRLSLLSNLVSQPGLGAVFTSSTPAEQAKIVLALHELYPGFASFAIISSEGRVDARWPGASASPGENVSAEPFFRGAMASGHPYISEAVQQSQPPRELVILLVTPVRSRSGHVVGLLTASIPGAALGSLIGGTNLPGGAALELFDQDGHLLSGASASAKRSFAALPAVSRALAGQTGAASGAVPGYGGDRLVGYASVPSAHWGVLVEEPASVLNDDIAALTERLAAIGLVVVILAIATGALIASSVKNLSRERERAGALMASVGEGVATIAPDGRLQSANPALGRMLGAPDIDLVGKSWDEALRFYDERGHTVAWAGSLTHQAIEQRTVVATTGYERFLARADGRRLPVSVTAAPLLAGEELLGAVLVLRDISSEREVDQLKSSLVSTVSHELRTPLTMVQGFAELLIAREDLGEQRCREALGQIHSSALRLGRLIDDLLSVSRIDSGKLRVDLAAVDVAQVLYEVERAVAATPNAGRLVVNVAPGFPAVLADRDKLFQVVTNLVSNALKYSEAPRPVTVVATCGPDHAEISVADQGIGLSETECKQVFEKFVRADHPEVRKVSGTGLGLYISKSLVEMQHGQIWVNSEPGQGSVFAFSLPLAPRAPQGPLSLVIQGAKER
ncbi:MAG TPA: ATP-binding protein [Acidimicrobiales bacterium]|nr:ATP-binding protein [Acidimicrobiales bacterium]